MDNLNHNFVLTIIMLISTVCSLECVWDTRFNPEKVVAFHNPRTHFSDWNFISDTALEIEDHQQRQRSRILKEIDEDESDADKTIGNTNIRGPITPGMPMEIEDETENQTSNQGLARLPPPRKFKRSTFKFKKQSTHQIHRHDHLPRQGSYSRQNKSLFTNRVTDYSKQCEPSATNVDEVPENANVINTSDSDVQTLALTGNSTVRNGSQTNRKCSPSKTLHIVGLFAMSGEYPAGIGYLPAAILAIDRINRNPDILSGYQLKLNVHNTRCSSEWGLDGLYTELYNKSRTSIMTLGTTCSHVSETTAKVSNIWGMVQISYSAVSPHLSNKTIFPSFFRVTTPEQVLTISRMHIFKTMNWSRVHTIYQNFKLFSTGILLSPQLNEQMIEEFKSNNITVVSSNMFTADPYQSVKELQEADARIIIGSFYEDKARMVMCAAYNLPEGYKWYKNVVWFLPSFLDRGWMDVAYHNCSAADIAQVLGQYFTIGSINYNLDPSYKPVGNVSREIFEDFNLYNETKDAIPEKFKPLYSHCKRSVTDCSLYAIHRAPQAFDAIWAIALALDNTLNYLKQTGDPRRLEDFDYGKNNPDLSCIIRQAMQNVTFAALSGPFHFNANGEGTANIGIARYNNSGGRNFTHVGNCSYFHLGNWSCYIQEDQIHWNTANGKPPKDGVQTRMRAIELDLGVKVTFFCLAGIGILISLSLLVFNIWNRNHKIIKMSSPRLNNIILVGSALGYIDIFLQDTGDQLELTICKVRLFTKPLSFCLMFGSLFAKTWRVYQIFTAGAQAYKLNKKLLRDSSLFLIVAGLVAITCGILAGWMVISPQQTVTANISNTGAQDISDLDVDIMYVNQFHHCTSSLESEFTIGLSVFQGLMMIFGTFLAVQTRKVSYPEFNDSRLIAMAIYNVVVIEPVGRITTWAIKDKPEIRYVLYNLMQITMSSVTLGLLFLPKIISYRRHNRKSSSGIEQNQSVNFNIRMSRNITTDTIIDCHSAERAKVQTPDDIEQKDIKTISSSWLPQEVSTLNETLKQNINNQTKYGKNINENSEIYTPKIVTTDSLGIGQDIHTSVTDMKFKTLKISPLALTEVVLDQSDKMLTADRSILFKRSLSDTNIVSVLKEEEDCDVLKEMDGSKSVRSAQKPQMPRHFSNTYHDDTFIQEIKFKAGVKLKGWSGIFGRSNMGLKASWKQKSYTQTTDKSSTVDLIVK